MRFSEILICKRAGENFGLVFNELRVFGGFRALDNLGLRAGSTLGFDLALLPMGEPGPDLRLPGSPGKESSNIRKKTPIQAQNPPKAGSF